MWRRRRLTLIQLKSIPQRGFSSEGCKVKFALNFWEEKTFFSFLFFKGKKTFRLDIHKMWVMSWVFGLGLVGWFKEKWGQNWIDEKNFLVRNSRRTATLFFRAASIDHRLDDTTFFGGENVNCKKYESNLLTPKNWNSLWRDWRKKAHFREKTPSHAWKQRPWCYRNWKMLSFLPSFFPYYIHMSEISVLNAILSTKAKRNWAKNVTE